MPDISAMTPLSESLKDFGYKTGWLIDQRFADMDVDRQQKLDAAIATLSGQDATFNAIIENMLRITDAAPGTAEWDEGQNLYTLMQTNYVALDDRLVVAENKISALETWKTGFVTSYNEAITRIDAALLLEKTTREAEVTRIEGLIVANQEAVNAANAARATLKSQLEAMDASQTEEINALKTRITANEQAVAAYAGRLTQLEDDMALRVTAINALNIKQLELAGRVETLEAKVGNVSAAGMVAEFAAGLSGQASPGGYAQPTA